MTFKELKHEIDHNFTKFNSRWESLNWEHYLDFEISKKSVNIFLDRIIVNLTKTNLGLVDFRGFDFDSLAASISKLSATNIRKNKRYSEPDIKSLSYNFSTRTGILKNVDFSYSKGMNPNTKFNTNVIGCRFDFCELAGLFTGNIIGSIFANTLLNNGIIGAQNKIIEDTVFDNVSGKVAGFLGFNRACFVNCKFLNLRLFSSSVRYTTFRNCVFDCEYDGKNPNYDGTYSESIVFYGKNSAMAARFGRLSSLLSRNFVSVSFIDCDLRNLYLKSSLIESDVVFENCRLPDSMGTHIVNSTPFYKDKDVIKIFGLFSGLFVGIFFGLLFSYLR